MACFDVFIVMIDGYSVELVDSCVVCRSGNADLSLSAAFEIV